jgi:hypothetical protein
MTVSIIRWKGGAAGDLLSYLINESSIRPIENVKFKNICVISGKIILDFEWIDYSDLREIDKIALYKSVDLSKIELELSNFDKTDTVHWIKSHYYQHPVRLNQTIDIVIDNYSLSFAGIANVTKTVTLDTAFNKFVGKLAGHQKKQYTLYAVMWDQMYNNKLVSDKKILLSEMISGYDRLYDACCNVGIFLDNKCKEIYKCWFDNNKKFLPSAQYLNCLKNNDFDIEKNKSLALHEKYSLMVLDKQKFKFI